MAKTGILTIMRLFAESPTRKEEADVFRVRQVCVYSSSERFDRI